MSATVLVVDDKPNLLSLATKILAPHVKVVTAKGVGSAVSMLDAIRPDVVLCDLRMPDGEGLEVLRAVRAKGLAARFILMTAYGSIPMAVQAIREGVFDIVTKPFDPDQLVTLVLRAAAASGPIETLPATTPVAPQITTLGARPLDEMTYREVVDGARDEVVRRYLESLLARFHGNVTAAAARAGVERESFHRLMRRYDLRAEAYRGEGDRSKDDDED